MKHTEAERVPIALFFESDSCPCRPTEQSQDSLQRFEHQAGLTDDVYSPHKGLSAEETRSPRLADGTIPVSPELKHRAPHGRFGC